MGDKMKNEKLKTKKQEIIDTTTKLVQEKGYDNITVQARCEACHISKHTFYYYFESKDQVLHSHYSLYDDIDASVMMAMLEETSAIEQIWVLYKTFILHIQKKDKNLCKQMMLSKLQNENMFREEDFGKPYYRLQIELIEKAMKNGEIHTNASSNHLAGTLISAYVGCIMIWIVTKEKDFDLLKESRNIFDIIFHISKE